MVCSTCAVKPQQKPPAQTVANAAPPMLSKLGTTTMAIDVDTLVSDPVSRKALVAALAAGRVILIDGNKVVGRP